jgi:hypothetical protein
MGAPAWPRGLLVGCGLVLALLLGAVPPALAQAEIGAPEPVDPEPAQGEAAVLVEPEVTFVGSGFGHGRGMGQYGARGYATLGAPASQILDHFYGGTTAGTLAGAAGLTVDPNALRVALLDNDGHPTVVTTATGTLLVTGPQGEDALTFPAGEAVRLWYRPAFGIMPAGYEVERAPSCAGPWTWVARLPYAEVHTARLEGPGDSADTLLAVCEPDGRRIWHAGQVRAVSIDIPLPGRPCDTCRTIAVVPVEEYLRGVVPREMPSSWPAAALQAQAVAARSYATAGDTRHRYADGRLFADTCDTTLCQVYLGRFFQDPGGAVITSTAATTDAAIAGTTGVVRLRGNGTVARTEFSASTGGFSAGGEFPPVPDEGDAVQPNAYHRWTRTVQVTGVDQAYGRGRLIAVEVLARNGYGGPHGDGGRVTSVRLQFDAGSPVVLTGAEARSLFGLPSDWFTPGQVLRPEYEGSPEARFIDAAYQRFVGRAASTLEKAYWFPIVQTGERWRLTGALAVSDEWAGYEIDQLYRTVLGRGADGPGRAYWLDRVRRGAKLEDIAAGFYGSAEYLARNGGTNAGFVDALYRDILRRGADPPGLVYWTDLLDRRRIDRTGVAAQYYASPESRQGRVVRLYQEILGRPPEPAGLDYWSVVVFFRGDVVLAADLAASEEFFRRANS